MQFYAGMDIGGSNARIALAAKDGTPLGEYTGEGATINVVGRGRAAVLYAGLVLKALAAHGLNPADCAGLCVAASGVDSPGLAAECKSIFTAMGFGAHVTRVVNDCEVYLLAVDGPAIVLTAGTGSIAVGRGADGAIHRCGGWGHLLSDEGSGFYMGLAVLRAVGDHLDGRFPCPTLYQLFAAQSELREPIAINAFAVQNLNNKKEIARFAPLLDKAAEQGDEVANAILEDCAGLLYQIVLGCYEKLALPENTLPTLLLWGSVLLHSTGTAGRVRALLQQGLGLEGHSIQYPQQSALHTALAAAKKGG